MLLFIFHQSTPYNRMNWVSIHHMLLFIFICALILDCFRMFQYITCYSLSLVVLTEALQKYRFNTSHVTLYLGPMAERKCIISVSIHHMLLFIQQMRTILLVNATFQYITCYSLSHLQWLLLPHHHRFNTSHVTLYRVWGRKDSTG